MADVAGLWFQYVRYNVGSNPTKHPNNCRKENFDMARDLDLAVVMIVKNEEKNIANMFNSFRDNGLNPDFYITDTGSTDNTVKIC